MIEENSTILLDCLNLQAEPARSERLNRLDPAAWEAVLAQADLHRVKPWLYLRLRDLQVSLPAEIETRLKETYQKNIRRNKVLFLELGRVLALLGEQGIPALAFKGLHLAGDVYQSLGARQIMDIDLLVHREHLTAIEAAMLGHGCRPSHQNRVIGPDIYDFCYFMPQTSTPVEFHWALIYSKYLFEPDIDGIWQRAQAISLSDTRLTVMAPEDLLLYLCLHATKHWYELRLSMLCDISAVLVRYQAQLDWETIAARASEWRMTHSAYLMLRLAHELLAAPAPDEWLQRLQPAGFDEPYLQLALEQFLAKPDESGERFASPFAVVEIWGTQGTGKKLRILWQRLFPSRETMALLYPAKADSWRIYPYYLVRIKDLLLKFGGDAWDLARGDPEKKELVQRSNRARELQEWLKSA